MSWIMRIQNKIISDPGSNDFPLHDLISIFMPSLGGIHNSDVFADAPFYNLHTSANLKPDASVQNFARPEDSRDEVSSANRSEAAGKSSDAHQPLPETRPSAADSDGDEEDERVEDEDDEDEDDGAHSDIGDAAGMRQRSATESAVTLANCPSGPINIPRVADKHKVPSGSFSDVEPEELDDEESEDVAFDENDTRSRNPVRRVNSSPEMSSNWRNTYTKGALASGGAAGGLSTVYGGATAGQTMGEEDAVAAGDDAQLQKKKNYGKDMRVSCEAIPEEIADSTPPKQTSVAFVKPAAKEGEKKTLLALDVAKAQPVEFQGNKPVLQNMLLPPASLPTTSKNLTTATAEVLLPGPHNHPPKKQHSADDALNVQQQQQQQTQQPSQKSEPSGSGNLTNKIKPNIEITKLISKPPQSPTPLSPRLLAKSSTGKLSTGEFPRGRSKTISVVRGSELDNRDNSKWPFRGSKC